MIDNYFIEGCHLCPRNCMADRTEKEGYCGGTKQAKVARAALHFWEEPCISGQNGSGTVFFSGCQLKCCYCQNYKISAENFGKEISTEQLGRIFLNLQKNKAHNINLVSPTQYVPFIIEALDSIKSQLKIPVVYNTGGYETIETLKLLEGYVDIYLTDLKYMDPVISKRYSNAEDYFEYASKANAEMFNQVGKVRIDDNGIMQKGVIIRHLVLPNNRCDSMKVLDWVADNFNNDDILISLMSQYTPFYKSSNFKEISRRISTFEYNKVLDHALSLGLKGYMQEKSSAKEEYTPLFDLEGV